MTDRGNQAQQQQNQQQICHDTHVSIAILQTHCVRLLECYDGTSDTVISRLQNVIIKMVDQQILKKNVMNFREILNLKRKDSTSGGCDFSVKKKKRQVALLSNIVSVCVCLVNAVFPSSSQWIFNLMYVVSSLITLPKRGEEQKAKNLV